MTTTSIELTPAELELINAERAEAKALADREAAEQARREEKARNAQERHNAQVASLRKALLEADTNNILFTKKSGIYFMLDGREQEIEIVEHHVYSGWRKTSNLEYCLRGGYNNYKTRYYKNPKTVLARITEYQEAAVAKRTRADAAKNLLQRALEVATETYPNATVTAEEGWGNYRKGMYRPNLIKVATDRGSYEFTFSDLGEEGIHLAVWKRTIGKAVEDQVRELILG